MKIKTTGLAEHEVTVDVSKVLGSLKIRLRFADRFGEDFDLTTHNGIRGIYKIEDVSHHGSPIWEYTLITDKESDIKAFECIGYLLDHLKTEANGND